MSADSETNAQGENAVPKKSVIAVRGLLYLLALLSIAAGVPKLMQAPQELAFLSALGIGGLVVSALGAWQALGGALLFAGRTRLAGGVLAGTAFLVSSAALLVGGNTAFGLVSLLPLVLLVVALGLDRKVVPPAAA